MTICGYTNVLSLWLLVHIVLMRYDCGFGTLCVSNPFVKPFVSSERDEFRCIKSSYLITVLKG